MTCNHSGYESALYVVFYLVEENDILKPEKVLSLLYDKELMKIRNKRYVIVNIHNNIEDEI